MKLYSTRLQAPEVTLREAVFKGLPPDNGLYMPTEIPLLSNKVIEALPQLSFQEIAFEVSKLLLQEEVSIKGIREIVEGALIFEAPAQRLSEQQYVLELFHGPTLAFKDFGARFMSRLMSYFLQDAPQEIDILVATSGDTGSAVAQGFLNVPGIRVTILYPKGQVSRIQELQLTTAGHNVTALEVDGNFDDCQRMVKEAFLDEDLNQELQLTSANSINISRLIPQSFYYFRGYSQMADGKQPVVFCTPSGNFGNLSAGFLAREMGLPIAHFVAATNANKVVPEYLRSGDFDPQPSIRTISNAMDVGHPSNFPRMLKLHQDAYEKMTARVTGYFYDDAQTRAGIKSLWEQYEYLACPHSAIGYLGLHDFLKQHPEYRAYPAAFLATAHPAKFPETVEAATGQSIPTPPRLQEIIEQQQERIPTAANLAALKSYLLSRAAV